MSKPEDWPTELAARLAGRGPMPFRDYMAESLYAEELGYYTRRDLRRRGDRPTGRPAFVAELVQPILEAFLSFADEHEPRLVDHGPGAGLLVRYLLSTMPQHVRGELDVTFVEPRLARRSRLLVLLQEFGVDGRVVSTMRDVEPGASFLIARELLGSFPVHWMQRTPNGWREVHVDVPADAWDPVERLEPPPPQLAGFLDEHAAHVPEGHRYEVNLPLRGWLSQARQRLEAGLVCVLDRPIEDPPGQQGSILGLRNGSPVDVYAAPGLTDVSAGVDLEALRTRAGSLGLREISQQSPAGRAGHGPLEAVVFSPD